MGLDAVDAIRYFAQRDKIFKVHFRNVDQPLPHFTETFVDNGYMDMYQIMKVLQQCSFKGIMVSASPPGAVSLAGRVVAVGAASCRRPTSPLV